MRTKQFQILTDINLVWDFLTDIYFSVRKGYEYLADELVEYAITNMPDWNSEQQFDLWCQALLTE